ncbi:MAG: LysR family transcriptional regulator [Acutalibacteraceae bacterium]|nr:LysR family transcriptional regulator [Acutalibacteraceae bacterium]
MNLLHMKYAVEIAETKSINKTAEKLFVGQSALSRAIKELEASLGVTLFERSAKGMFLTPDGEVFVRYAKNVLKQVDVIENMFSEGNAAKKQFSVSVPRASYIADAFAQFSKLIEDGTEAELFYKETNAMRAIKNILNDEFKLGIIRYAESYDKYYKEMMDEKGLEYELITEFRYMLLMNRESPLAKKEKITYEDLRELVMIAHADPYVPSLPLAQVKKEELPDNSDRKIFIFERASQFELLAENHDTFMWSSPIPQSLLDRYGLVQRYCDENKRMYKDILIHRRDYTLSELDNMFVSELVKAKRRTMGEET